MNIQYRHRHGQRSIVRLADTHTDFVMWIMWMWLWHWYSEMMVISIILLDAMQCITSVCIVQWQCGLNGMQSLFLCLLILSSILGIIKRYGFRFSQQLLYGSSISVDIWSWVIVTFMCQFSRTPITVPNGRDLTNRPAVAKNQKH